MGLCVSCMRKPFLKHTTDGPIDHSRGNEYHLLGSESRSGSKVYSVFEEYRFVRVSVCTCVRNSHMYVSSFRKMHLADILKQVEIITLPVFVILCVCVCVCVYVCVCVG